MPKLFPVEVLNKFNVGEAEGKTDSLLEECLCEIPPIKEFLLGKKDIILGERGAGKTALFRMLSERKLNFFSPPGKTYQILALDESIEYKQLKTIIEQRIQASGSKDNDSIKYQFIWELFLTYKILCFVTDELKLDQDDLAKYKNEISAALGFEDKKVGIMQFLLSHKKTIGIKLDQLHPATSNFYVSAEPIEKLNTSEDVFKVDLKEIKKKVSSLLDKNHMVLYVLLDRLDEFVIKEDYAIQKRLLEGLMACYRNFSSSTQIRIKPFFRTDIFNRLDISGLGTDKILSKTVHLKWEPNDLRELIARRLFYNFTENLDIANLEFETDEGRLHLDPKYVEDEKIRTKNDKRNFITRWGSKKWKKLVSDFIIQLQMIDRRERKTNFSDAITTDIIHQIFPKSCEHTTSNGKKEYIKFIDFIDSHLSFATDFSTPRVVIDFFEECLYETRSYYAKNKDIVSVPKNFENEYELVKVECITRAYIKIKQKLWGSISRDSIEWENKITDFKVNLTSKLKLNYQDIASNTNWDSEKEAAQFIAFLMHAGILKCINREKTHIERVYELPLMFREPKQSKLSTQPA